MLFTPPYLEHLEPGHEIWNLDEKQAKFIDNNDKRASFVHIPQFCNFHLRLIYQKILYFLGLIGPFNKENC
jgi:hypothetical protein